VSATEEQSARLRRDGPRRDFVELARATGGEISYQREHKRRRGLWARVWGPHVRQAWQVASDCEGGDGLFLDGEHIGIPALFALALRRKRPGNVVVLGHLPARWWKLPLLWLGTRLGARGVLVVHSRSQAAAVRGRVGRSWRVELVPYQVDTAYWTPAVRGSSERPVVVSAGSEHRDHQTLVEAARGLDAEVVIAAGSHWARTTAEAAALPSNVQYLTEPLPFAELRELYRRASIVVVALEDVANQSGVTTILEAMSVGKPVIVTATRGQQEVVSGPMVTADGSVAPGPAIERGPQRFPAFAAQEFPQTGLYVPVGDEAALRIAIRLVLGDKELAQRLGQAGRETVERCFGIERYTQTLAGLLTPGGAEPVFAGAVPQP
jgi:glycosyltransferase involved in cell wall biosynthesis